MEITQGLLDDHEQLRECMIIIRRDYNTYTALYCDENSLLLGATAPTFFTDLAEILQRDWILQVVKLMDPAETKIKGGKRENLTIRLVSQQLDKESLLTVDISEKEKAILDFGELLKPARDRILAHRDRHCHYEGLAMGATTDAQLNSFIQDIQDYCDLVGIQIGVGPLDFSASGCEGDVLDLLKHLRMSVARAGGV